MKAIIHTSFGRPEVLRIAEVEKPIPKDDEVLVKVHYSTVNRSDTGFRKPEYLMVLPFTGFLKPKNPILGTEYSGVIESIGKNVSKFKVGDAVFGLRTFKFGTQAEYVCINESTSIALKPTNYSMKEAGGVTEGLFLSYNYLKRIDFKKEPTILINGTSGSIGSAGLQLAKYLGAKVTAVCNTKNVELMKTLGADEVIDFEKEDFTKCGKTFDNILDAVGKSSFFKCKKLLKPGGAYFSTELGTLSQNVYLALWTPFFSNKKVKFPIPKDNQEDLLFFKKIIEEGKYKAVIDKVYPMNEIVAANKYVDTGQKTGNVLIEIQS